MSSLEEKTTYRAVRIDDTADWRMIIYISRTGMSACLKNEADPMEPLINIFSDSWSCGEDELLHRIEGVVYDHPQLLDDFSTEIVISTERALWIPRSAIDPKGNVGADEEYLDETDLYNVAYKAEDEDIFIDEFDEKVCLYTLIPGLQSFILRTLPGARTWCQQTVAVKRFSDQTSDMPRLYIDIRDREADYYAFDGRRLLLAATHPWRDKMDIAGMVFNIADLWNLDMDRTQVMLSGKRDIRTELLNILRDRMKYVMLTMLPSAISKSDLPLAVGLLVAKK